MSDPTFLTRAELEALTSYRRPADQLRKLREWGIEPFVTRDGLQVCREVVVEAQRRLSGLEAREAARRGPRPRLRQVK